MSTEIVEKTGQDMGAALLEKVLLGGDLAALSAQDRLVYYQQVCRSLNLNPLTRPFEYLKLNGKIVLYARRDAADQLRRVHGISITRVDVSYQDDLVIVTVAAQNAQGRSDTDVGAVALGNVRGEARANAIKKCVTQAKRRVTLSICGLGVLDETEVEAVAGAERVELLDAQGRAPAPAGARATQPSAAQTATAGDAEQATTIAGAVGSGASFPERAAAALAPAEWPGHQTVEDQGVADLRTEVVRMLTGDGPALDLLKAKGALPPEMTGEQLRKTKRWLEQRAARHVAPSTLLARQIEEAASEHEVTEVLRRAQTAKDQRQITQAEWVSLLREGETRRTALAGPLTAGAAP